MNRILVWDFPTRTFHWLVAALVLACLAIAGLTHEESPAFLLHMLVGLVLVPLLVFRVLWGFVGSRYARFTSFMYTPGEVIGYLSGIPKRTSARHVGHNPLAGYVIFSMLLILAGIIGTGLLAPGGSELFEELHGALGYAVLALMCVHLLGVIIHGMIHRENIVLSMVSGRKEGVPEQGIASSRPIVAVLFLAIVGIWAVYLVKNYDPAARRIDFPFAHTSLQLAKAPDRPEQHDEDDD